LLQDSDVAQFTTMTPLEPRLIKKLIPPLTEIINSTAAMSLLYEAIQAVIAGGMLSSGTHADILANTCVTKLRTFLEANDQNRIPPQIPGADKSKIRGPIGIS
jgi:AP-3 complex subunit delta